MAEIANALIGGLQAGQQAGEDRRRRNALTQAGQAYAAGDTTNAMNMLVAAGMPQEAAQYSALDEAKRANAARTAAQQAVTNLGADATVAQQAHAAAGAYMGAGDFDQGLQLTQAWQQLDASQRQQVAQAHDAVASFALGQIQRAVPVEQRAADAAAHAQDFSQQTGIPIEQVQQMIQHQTDWSDNGLKALAAEHRSASDQLAAMTEESHFQTQVGLQRAQIAATVARSSQEMDAQTVEYQARQYRQTGRLPPLGMGASAAAARLRIISEAARQAQAEGSSAEADVIRQRALQSESQALGRITTQMAQIHQFEDTALRNLDLALQASSRVQRTGSPIINDILQTARVHGTGDPSAQQLAVAVNSFAEEYAKVMSGSTGGQAATDSARQQAHSMINTGMTVQQIQATATQMRAEMANRMEALQGEQASLQDAMQNPILSERPDNTVEQNENSQTTRSSSQTPARGPAVGSVQRAADGHQYRFKGGNPNDRNNWEQIDNLTIQGRGGAQRPL